MAVFLKNGQLVLRNKKSTLGSNTKLNLGLSGYSQALFYSFLFCYPSFSYAGPLDGNIVGGQIAHGSDLSQVGNITNINQITNLLAIDWASYNLNANEIVNYIQPGSNSIALNRILGDSASQIHGQINANGNVILVNPNGLFFSPSASINVGGLIASGLDIDPVDFMNGDYIFNEVLGTDGTVINRGIINASLGGSVALLGKQVINEGVISAQLGSVNLAAGKAAVLTFDNQGLLGVKITKEILQDELGIDPAVINSGEINAESGRVLLTASVSQDVFSQAVNSGNIQQATSVVVNDDGTFTLGAGADVLNSGTINVSARSASEKAGQVVVLGENITHSGVIRADAVDQNAGEIELHSNDTTLIIEDSITSTVSESANGGVIKVLGNWVGALDESILDASGFTGGGTILIGGDYQGENNQIKNAQRTYIGEGVNIYADATSNGNGGKVIIWADESTQYYGSIFARGGRLNGDGGFAEVSGKQSLIFDGFVDLSALNGRLGQILLDPKNILISTDPTSDNFPSSSEYDTFEELNDQSTILNNVILGNNLTGNIALRANNNITIAASVNAAGSGNLTLEAGKSISLTNGADVTLAGGNFSAVVDYDSDDIDTGGGDTDTDVYAADRDSGLATFTMSAGSVITTNGGDISITTQTGDITNSIGDFSLETLTTTGVLNGDAGSIDVINDVGAITVNSTITANGGAELPLVDGNNAGNITLSANGDVTVLAAISSNGTNGGVQLVATNQNTDGGNAGSISITTGNNYTQSANISSQRGSAGTGGVGGTVGNLSTITLNGDLGANIFNINAGASYSGSPVTISLLGGSDLINLNAAITATINAGTGTDTIRGLNTGTNTWNVTDSNIGTLINGTTVNFNFFENLTGGASIDNFTIAAVGAVTGTINGGGGVNTLSKTNGTNAWILNGAQTGTITGVVNTFTDIQTINGSGVDTITAQNQDNNWSITGANAGNVEEDIVGLDNVAFTGMQNLNGNNGADAFVMNNGSSISGEINAAGGSSDTVNLTAIVANTSVIMQSTGTENWRITNAESISARTTTTNTLVGDDSGQAWDIDNVDAGNIDSTIVFSGFKNITGGTGDDQFVFSTVSSQLTLGTITGGGGNDTVTGRDSTTNTWTLNAIDGGSVSYGTTSTSLVNIDNYIGGNSTDNFNMSSTISGSITGNGGNDTLTISTAGAHTWSITGLDTGTVDASLTGGFFGIDNLVGNGSVDTFTLAGGTISGDVDGLGGLDILNADDLPNTWNITTLNGGTVNGVGSFTNVDNLNGNDDTDNFNFNGGILSGDINGGTGAGINTLQGDNFLSLFDITGINSGSYLNFNSFTTVDFSNIQNLNGNANQDVFRFLGTSGSISGLINGRGGSFDSLDISQLITDVTVEIGNNSNGNLNVFNVETITAVINDKDLGAPVDLAINTLIGDNLTNNWRITGADQGTINGLTVFQGFNNLQGNAQADVFSFNNGGSISGVIDAVDGSGIDIADVSLIVGALNFNLGLLGGSFQNFDRLIGNNNSTLIADVTVSNNWFITDNNSGNIDGIDFINFNNLTGGDLVDTFSVTGDGSISGIVIGGAGDDIVNISLSLSESGSFNFDGTDNTDSDIINITNGLSTYSETYTSNAGGFQQISYAFGANTYNVNYIFTENVNDTAAAGSLTINGTINDDLITLNTAQFTVNSAQTVNIANKDSLFVNAVLGVAGASNVIDIMQDVNYTGGTVSLSAESITNTTGSVVLADTFIINNASNLGDVGNQILTDVSNLELNNVSGDVFINEQGIADDINITALNNVTGTLNLTNQSGDILDGANLISSVNMILESSIGNLTFNNANQLNGDLSLIALNGNVNFNNIVNSNLALINTQNLVIDSSGITNTAASTITASGTSSFTSSGQNIILNGAGHSFNDLTVSNTANLTLLDSNVAGLTISNISVAGDADVTSSGSINLNTVSAGSTASLTSNGAIIDANAASTNMTATNVVLHAATGIGETSNAIETVTSSLDVVNSTSGEVVLNNIGEVNLIALKNLGSSGDITIENDGSYLINPGSVDAGYNTGALIMRSTGSYLGQGAQPPFTNADITARAGTFFGFSGTFGTTQRPIVLNIRDSALIQTRASLNPQFAEPRPIVNDESLLQFSGLDTLSAIAGEQLVEVETLAEVDQAIFTDLQNFSMEEISIRMPRDQLFEDELEEYDRAK